MLNSPSQFRAEPPPALSSRKWAKEFNEIKAYGAVNSTVRTPEQTAVAKFWNANAVNQSNQAFQDVAIAHRMDLVDTARVLAMGDLVDSDAGIACWDSKYHYLFWRPIMAIRNAQIDGNPATHARSQLDAAAHDTEPPRIPRSPHLRDRRRGRDVRRRARNAPHRRHHPGSADGTPNNWATTHTFKTVNDLQREVANARVWAGLHYRGSARAGLELARNVARWTLRRYFLPVADHHSHADPRAER